MQWKHVHTLVDAHFASVSVFSLWSIHFKVFIVMKTITVFLRLQDSLQSRKANAYGEFRSEKSVKYK